MSEDSVNFSGRRIDGADFSAARLHEPDFGGAKITDAWFVDADFSGDVSGLRVNGVEVAPLIEAELDRQHPERRQLRADDPVELRAAWSVVEDLWGPTVTRARALPPALTLVRVDGEWSFTETLRHLVFATDVWQGRMIKGQKPPYSRWGLAGSFLPDPERLGLAPSETPSLEEVLVVRDEHMASVRATIDAVTADELSRTCQPPDTTGHPKEPRTVLECLHVILNEEWWHCRYANRDLSILEDGER